MKFFALFIAVSVMAFIFSNVLTRRERKKTIRSIGSWIAPVLIAAIATTALILFNVNFNGKII